MRKDKIFFTLSSYVRSSSKISLDVSSSNVSNRASLKDHICRKKARSRTSSQAKKRHDCRSRGERRCQPRFIFSMQRDKRLFPYLFGLGTRGAFDAFVDPRFPGPGQKVVSLEKRDNKEGMSGRRASFCYRYGNTGPIYNLTQMVSWERSIKNQLFC